MRRIGGESLWRKDVFQQYIDDTVRGVFFYGSVIIRSVISAVGTEFLSFDWVKNHTEKYTICIA